jgi:hypothetical protein
VTKAAESEDTAVTTAVTSIGRAVIRPWSGWGDVTAYPAGVLCCPSTARRNGACKNLGRPHALTQIQDWRRCDPQARNQSECARRNYQVTKRLPENEGEFEYCIKNLEEPYARVVRESELRKA